MCCAAYFFGFNDANGKSPKPGNVFQAITSSYAAAVFIVVPIDNVMVAIFDVPVAAVGGQNALSVCLLRSLAGNAAGGFTGGFTAFFICGFPLDNKGLSDMGEVLPSWNWP